MKFRIGILICILILALSMNCALADRLLLIPTGTTLGTGDIKADYLTRSGERAYWVNVGISILEVEGARFENGDSPTAFSAQLGIMPETTFTPAIAVGARDITDETGGSGALYRGRAFYLAASKGIPITGGIPLLFQDMKVHGGIGTGSLSGLFFGVEGTIPAGLRIMAEYDSDDFNYGASYSIVPSLTAKAASLKGDFYYGVGFSLDF